MKKKNYAKQKLTTNLISYKCIEGAGNVKVYNSTDCSDGTTETYSVTSTGISVSFGECLPPWTIGLICGVAGLAVIFIIIVFATPLKYKIFPFLRDSQERSAQLKKEEEQKKRQTQIDEVEDRLGRLKGQIDEIRADRDRLQTLIQHIDGDDAPSKEEQNNGKDIESGS